MANQTITQLNAAGAITGSELVPIVQNGQTVRTTTGAIAASPSLTQTFLTVNNEPTLNNSRYLTSTGSGIGITDNGAQSTLALSLSTPLQTLDTSGAGLLAKTGSNTVTNRSIAVGGGLAVSNASGAAGNPTINLDGVVLALQNSSGTFLLGRTAGGGIATLQLLGTAGEIDVADGTGPSNPTIGLADNPVLPGTEGVVVPSGTTGQRAGSPTNGEIRYNTSNNILEAYTNNIWGVIPTSTASVTSISQGSGITLTPNPIVGAGTVAVSTNGITDALFRQSAGLSVVGRSANTTGNVADVVAGTDNQVLRRSGTAIGFGAVNLASSDAVTGDLPYANLTQGSALSVLGVTGNAAADVASIAAGTDHQVLRRSGTALDFGAVDLAQSAAITGTLPVGNGGTGLSTYTLGDTVYYAAGTSLTKLGIGSSTYIMTSSGTAPQWTDPATITVGSATAATTATNIAGGAAGSIVYNSAASTTTFLALGTQNYVLTAGSSAPQYTAQSSLAVGTATNIAGGAAGSVPYQTGAGATSLLALGTQGYVLRAGAAAPEWAAVDGGVFT